MSEIAARGETWLDGVGEVLRRVGRAVFAFAMLALGVETLMYARDATDALGPQYKVIPVLPWLPARS